MSSLDLAQSTLLFLNLHVQETVKFVAPMVITTTKRVPSEAAGYKAHPGLIVNN
jgi:hypothetical protein